MHTKMKLNSTIFKKKKIKCTDMVEKNLRSQVSWSQDTRVKKWVSTEVEKHFSGKGSRH